MNNKIAYLAAAALSLTALSSCSDNWSGAEEPAADSTGHLDLGSMAVEVNSNATTVEGASRATFNLSAFPISVTDAAGQQVYGSTFGAMNGLLELAAGNYTITAASEASPALAAFDAPYYKGSKEFAITNGVITPIGTVTCNLANLKVSVRFTSELRAALTPPASVKVKVNNTDFLEFNENTTSSGYFLLTDGSESMVAEFSGVIDGTPIEMHQVITDYVLPGYHRIITFGISRPDIPDPDPSGSIDPTGPTGITIDASITTIDENTGVTIEEEVISNPGDRPGSDGGDEPSGPDTPGADTITFASDYLSLTEINDCAEFGTSGKPAVVDIHSDEPIANLLVKIDSSTLTPSVLQDVGLDAEFDLANPGSMEEGLQSLGFATGSDVVGKNDVKFDITEFMPLLPAKGKGLSTFIITVVDSKGASKTLSLRIEVK